MAQQYDESPNQSYRRFSTIFERYWKPSNYSKWAMASVCTEQPGFLLISRSLSLMFASRKPGQWDHPNFYPELASGFN